MIWCLKQAFICNNFNTNLHAWLLSYLTTCSEVWNKVCFYHYCIVGFFEVYKFCVFRRCWSFMKFNPLKKQTSYPLQCWSLADPFMKMKSWKLKISHSWNLSTLKKPTIRYIDKINVILHIQVVLIAVLWTYLKATLRESMECVGGCRQIIIKCLLVNFQ